MQRINSVDADGTAVNLSTYMKGKTYKRLRMVCDFGGRLVNITNFSLTYNDGVVLDTLAMGAAGNNGRDTQVTITGITDVPTNGEASLVPVRALCKEGIVTLAGLTPNKAVTLYATDGRELLRFVPTATHAAVKLNGYEGVVIVKQ